MVYDLISERHAPPYRISSPSDAYTVLKRYSNARTERFLVVLLNGAHDVISTRIITVGLLNKTIVHCREVFRPAIVENAAALLLSHNHPSSRLDPSSQDLDITKRLQDAGELLGIPVLDHLIIGRSGFYSMVENGLMTPPGSGTSSYP